MNIYNLITNNIVFNYSTNVVYYPFLYIYKYIDTYYIYIYINERIFFSIYTITIICNLNKSVVYKNKDSSVYTIHTMKDVRDLP